MARKPRREYPALTKEALLDWLRDHPGTTDKREIARAFNVKGDNRAILREMRTWYGEWTMLGGDPESSGLRTAYKDLCTTLGRRVRVELPADETLEGTARDVDGSGRLVVEGPRGDVAVSAGDVIHVR